jgi:hypothetical protein
MPISIQPIAILPRNAHTLLPRRTPPHARVPRPKLARRRLLRVSVLTTAVALPVATGRAVCAALGTAGARTADVGGAGRADGLFVRCGDDFLGEVEPGVMR